MSWVVRNENGMVSGSSNGPMMCQCNVVIKEGVAELRWHNPLCPVHPQHHPLRPPMTEQRAREILVHVVQEESGHDTLLGPLLGYKADPNSSDNFVCWPEFSEPSGRIATLKGTFTADQLEAIAWWMRNKNPSAVEW